MAKNKIGLVFEGFDELIEQFIALGRDLKPVTEEALKESQKIVAQKAHEAMQKHHMSGDTEESIVEDGKVEWEGTEAGIGVGFDIGAGGLASIFLMYGTPRHTPYNQYGSPKRPVAKDNPGTNRDKRVYDAVYGKKTRDEIARAQERIFYDAISEHFGG